MLQHVRCALRGTIEKRHLVVCPVHLALGARSVITDNINEQGIVGLADFLYGTVKATYFIIRMLGKARISFHLTSEQLLLVGRERVPIFYVFRFWAELGICGNDAELLLTFKRFLADFVPTLIELAFVLVTPFGRYVVRSMGSTGRIVDIERLVGAQRLLKLQPRNSLVGHVGGEVIFRVFRQLDLCRSVIDQRCVLVGLSPDKAIKLFETGVRGPTVVRPSGRDLPGRRFVILAECRGAESILPENFG